MNGFALQLGPTTEPASLWPDPHRLAPPRLCCRPLRATMPASLYGATHSIMHVPDPTECTLLLREILALHPEGLSEYELLQRLRGDARSGFAAGRQDDPKDLFHTHFLLFHLLYRLREQLRLEPAGDLDIHTLKIRWHRSRTPAPQSLAPPDPLAVYYLDLNHLQATTRADVERMLGRFWARFVRYDRRSEALAVLELPNDADAQTILRQYRRLAMKHHPDRGGDAERLQAVHTAMAILDPRKPA